MRIRPAKKTDKEPILSFCKHTFRWGDYIDRVWDSWIADKNLLVVEQKGSSIGLCNMSFSKNQLWIEGIRIHPNFRRKGYAQSLVLKAESLARRKNITQARMIISHNNKKSLALAKSLGYAMEDKWILYNLMPKKQKTCAKIMSNTKTLGSLIQSDTYQESWNWLPLNNKSLSQLVKMKRVIAYSKNKKLYAMGIWNKRSKLDKNVMQLGYLCGTKNGVKEILRFMQNKGYEEKSSIIQLLIQHNVKFSLHGVNKRMVFCLMRKELWLF